MGAKRITHEPPPPPTGPRRLLGTSLTLVAFLAAALGLAVAPLPADWKPVDLSSRDEVEKVAARVFKKPRMTLAEHEERLAGGMHDGRDKPDDVDVNDDATVVAAADAGPAFDAQEDSELFAGRDVQDLALLQRVTGGDTPAALPPVDRAQVIAGVGHTKAARLVDQARAVGAPGVVLDNPCVEGTDDDCRRRALDPFFVTLDALARGDASARAGVVVLGNSLIASDHVTDIVRARLVERFGDGGRGFLLPDRLSKLAGRRVRTGYASGDWTIHTFAQDKAAPSPMGFSGSFHESKSAKDRTVWKTEGAKRARLFYIEHKGQPAMRLEARTPLSTTVIARIEPLGADAIAKLNAADPTGAARGRSETFEVELPRNTSDLTLIAEGPGARVSGVALEKDAPGVVFDTIGVPAASTQLYVEAADVGAFTAQLASRQAALHVVMLGGNEARAFNFGTLTREQFETQLGVLLDRLRGASPDGSCLVVAPIDAVKATAAGEELLTRPEIHEVIAIQKRVAKQKGCAHFDLFAAMGGEGSLSRFRGAGYLSDDLVHPTWRGGDVLGQLFADALLQSYAAGKPPHVEVPVFRRHLQGVGAPNYAGLSFPEREREGPVVKGGAGVEEPAPTLPLSKMFAQWSALERGERRRVAIGQFGASHTAAQMFTDRVRERLGGRFGNAGRGYVAIGDASKRLLPSGVSRKIDGPYELADGRDVVLGGALGMAGTKARLLPGARFGVGFCQGCKEGSGGPGTVQLAWLYTPDMGTAEVLLDGRPVATLSRATRNKDSDVQLLDVAVGAERALLEVVVRAEAADAGAAADDADAGAIVSAGPVNLLGVSAEQRRPGVIVDAVGLPGTTGMTPQRWRQDLWSEQIKARRYDLLVTFWGTNEAGIGSLDEPTYLHHFRSTWTTLRAASPQAECLIIGATDRLDRKDDGRLVPAPAHHVVESAQKKLAAELGCGFFSMRTAMGGPGSMKTWVKEGLALDDHVHFTKAGYQKIADLFVDDLLAAYAYQQAEQQRRQTERDGAARRDEAAAPAGLEGAASPDAIKAERERGSTAPRAQKQTARGSG